MTWFSCTREPRGSLKFKHSKAEIKEKLKFIILLADFFDILNNNVLAHVATPWHVLRKNVESTQQTLIFRGYF